MRREMKRGLAAAFAASLLVSTVALSAGNAQVDAALTDDGLSDTTTTVPVVGADDTTETTTTVSDVLGEETTTTTASGEETTGTETTTTTTQVITVQAKLHASFNGDNTDALTTDVLISSDNQAESYNISCMLTDPSTSLDYVYLDFSLSDNPTQAIRALCSGFTVTVTGVSTGADLTTTIPYTMAAEAVNYNATDASGNPVVRVTLYDSTVNGAAATTTTTADAMSATDIAATTDVAATTTALADDTVDPLATTTTAASTGTGYLAQDAPIVDNLQLTFQLTGLEYSPATTDTTTTVTKEAQQQTTTIIRSNSGSSGNSGNSGSYSSGGSSSATPSSSSGSTSTTTPTQTADLSVGAIVVGALAAISLAGAAFTVTRRRKK